jgi:hypothetical protein
MTRERVSAPLAKVSSGLRTEDAGVLLGSSR